LISFLLFVFVGVGKKNTGNSGGALFRARRLFLRAWRL
jgi:hypothetical protein